MTTRISPDGFRRKALMIALALLAGLLLPAVGIAVAYLFTDIPGPAGSGSFGATVTVLSNGNFVVTDPGYDAGTVVDVGAVYLYNGATKQLISTLVGSQSGDRVGSGGVTALSNGNYVVRSPLWDNGATSDAGAATWCSGTTGCTGVVSATNSLVGSTTGDQVSNDGVKALSNGNYVVSSLYWHNGAAMRVGAVTWGNGATGITGAVSITNSLVGSVGGDMARDIHSGGIKVLSNGNYVVSNPGWNNGAAADAGAVTWGNGTTGITGAISVTNSLVGSTTNDKIGYPAVRVLSNSNYVVLSEYWNNGAATDAGAATWGNGTTGITGVVSVTNSLVGGTTNNQVGWGVTELSNGNYVVRIPKWDNGAATDVGAATWGNGTTGITGVVSVANSLVGSTAGDQVGEGGITALTNGNYVVLSEYWDNGAATDAGAVTWGNGTTGITGVVSVTNSLVGNTSGDRVGMWLLYFTALSNGNYVVGSPYWDNGAATDAGAATWGNGATGLTGVVSVTNSLVGSAANDIVGWGTIAALSNGNYVVNSPYWDNGAATDVGAVTWGNGATGLTGVVSVTNSLVGSTSGDQVGSVIALLNGNYVVRSFLWDNGAAADAGAATWGNGTTGITGAISATNSLVGSTTGDEVGYPAVTVLSNGNYVVLSEYWDNGAATDTGAATWGNGTTGITGVVSVTNSLVGSQANDQVGYSDVRALINGNYVVLSPHWDNGAATDAGAATWGNGTTGITGIVSVTNSLVGSTAGDQVGDDVTALSDGNYVVRSPYWDNGAATDAGAVTLGNGATSVVGPITATNSVRGTATAGGSAMVFDYSGVNGQLVVGRPADNIVSIMGFLRVYLPLVRK